MPALAAVDVTPTTDATRFVARVSYGAGVSVIVVQDGADASAILPALGPSPFGRLVRARGRDTSRSAGGGTSVVRTYPAAPDGYAVLDLIDPSLDTFLNRARTGTTTLRAARVGAVATLRGTIRLGPNDCAGLRGGARTIDIDSGTLLPVRIITRRAGSPTTTLRIRVVRTTSVPEAALAPLRLRGDVFRDDQGFRRTTPAAAARNLPYTPELPAALPDGFTLAVSGWAPRSGITGAEGSIPPRPSLFAAVYARGWERIELTQRRAAGTRDWAGDPFAGECRPLSEKAVTVKRAPATYAVGPETGPHLYWREGTVLHTLSGPFPAETLVAVADSLAPVAAP